MTETTRKPRHRADAASSAALVLAAAGVLALATKLLLQNRWSSLSCGDGHTVVLDRLILAALACALLGAAAGVAALARRASHTGRALLAVAVSTATAGLILLPGVLGGYVCVSVTP